MKSILVRVVLTIHLVQSRTYVCHIEFKQIQTMPSISRQWWTRTDALLLANKFQTLDFDDAQLFNCRISQFHIVFIRTSYTTCELYVYVGEGGKRDVVERIRQYVNQVEFHRISMKSIDMIFVVVYKVYMYMPFQSKATLSIYCTVG